LFAVGAAPPPSGKVHAARRRLCTKQAMPPPITSNGNTIMSKTGSKGLSLSPSTFESVIRNAPLEIPVMNGCIASTMT